MAPVRTVGTGGIGVSTRWRRDNRPDFPGIAVWVDAVAEIEIDADALGFGEGGEGGGAGDPAAGRWRADVSQESDDGGFGAAAGGPAVGEWRGGGSQDPDGCGFGAAAGGRRYGSAGGRAMDQRCGELSQEPDDGASVPWSVDAWSPEYGKVWQPLPGSGREPRPGLLLSVVRAGSVVAYPTPLPDPPTGMLARALARLEPAAPRLLPVEPEPPRPRRTSPPKTYSDVRALVGIVVEILVGRRAATHATRFTDPEVRGKLRKPHYPRTAALKSVRLVESGDGVEATALLQDRGRMRVVALRFDRAEDSRWRCTALQSG